MKLILTEKPQASLRLAIALSDKPVKRSVQGVPYYELTYKKDKIVIVCAVGHLYVLAEKEKANKYPVFDVVWKESYIINKNLHYTKKYLDVIKRLSKTATEFYLATDLDTEGETLGYNILRFACNKKDAKRMEFSTLTEPDLIQAYENPKDHINFTLAEAGVTRHTLDFYYGINTSRALTSALKSAGRFKILSSGRVQSPTLALLAKREIEIQKFKPTPYWQIFAYTEAKQHLLKLNHKKDKFLDEKEAKNIYEKCKDKDAIVKKVTKKRYDIYPLPPFSITSLLTEAYRLFKYSPQRTMEIAQSLYLSALISYPRTSSEKLSPKIGYKNILQNLANNFKEAKELLKGKLSPIQGKKQDPAHIAIYPTSTKVNLSELTPEEKNLYTLIAKRFLASFADKSTRESLEVEFEINKEPFLIRGARTINPGWTTVYNYSIFKEVSLPELKEKEKYKVKKLDLSKGETKPPQRYSQGGIISEMEKRGLGTKATRPGILNTLYDRNYIIDQQIKVTKIGIDVAETLAKYVPDLVSEKLTRHFEKEMEQIQEGKKKSDKVIEEAKDVLIKILTNFNKKEKEIGKSLLSAIEETRDKESLLCKCPVCKKGNLRITYSRKNNSYFIACDEYPKCKTTFSLPFGLPKNANKNCDQCGWPIVTIIRKGKRPFEFCINPNCKSKEEYYNQKA